MVGVGREYSKRGGELGITEKAHLLIFGRCADFGGSGEATYDSLNEPVEPCLCPHITNRKRPDSRRLHVVVAVPHAFILEGQHLTNPIRCATGDRHTGGTGTKVGCLPKSSRPEPALHGGHPDDSAEM